MSDLRKHLKELAQLSLLANKISETQIKNLQMFPFVFFEGVKEVRIDYDLGHGSDKDKEVKHRPFMDYYLTMSKDDLEINRINIGLERRSKALEFSVRELFWNDIKVKVFVGPDMIYESEDA